MFFHKAGVFHDVSKNDYRSDIDGLRAVAIISVVIFHATTWLPGGFVGVDVFFVISGYLISKIIFLDISKNDFSFKKFYSRRVKRLFPALILVLTCCYIFGWFYLLPEEFERLGKHIAGSAGFIQNFILWSESGYFDVDSKVKPLLHIWSLGVEEQFYIVYPLLVYFLWKVKLYIFIAAAIIVSFIYSDSFYLPYARFWELLVGGY